MTWLEPIDKKDARRLALAVREHASDAREDLAERVASLSRHLRDVVEPRLEEARELVKHEAPIIADAALRQATRVAGRAKADPVPFVVGAVGVVLLASLLLGRRRT
jgi:vacuolar-type H+-ATPase subunit H